MRVFLLLADERGNVVTRDQLFEQVWGGVIVGDDSLNRAVGMVRKVGEDVAPGLFEIETIPRTGYRLTTREDPAADLADAGLRRRTVGRRGPLVGRASQVRSALRRADATRAGSAAPG